MPPTTWISIRIHLEYRGESKYRTIQIGKRPYTRDRNTTKRTRQSTSTEDFDMKRMSSINRTLVITNQELVKQVDTLTGTTTNLADTTKRNHKELCRHMDSVDKNRKKPPPSTNNLPINNTPVTRPPGESNRQELTKETKGTGQAPQQSATPPPPATAPPALDQGTCFHNKRKNIGPVPISQ